MNLIVPNWDTEIESNTLSTNSGYLTQDSRSLGSRNQEIVERRQKDSRFANNLVKIFGSIPLRDRLSSNVLLRFQDSGSQRFKYENLRLIIPNLRICYNKFVLSDSTIRDQAAPTVNSLNKIYLRNQADGPSLFQEAWNIFSDRTSDAFDRFSYNARPVSEPELRATTFREVCLSLALVVALLLIFDVIEKHFDTRLFDRSISPFYMYIPMAIGFVVMYGLILRGRMTLQIMHQSVVLLSSIYILIAVYLSIVSLVGFTLLLSTFLWVSLCAPLISNSTRLILIFLGLAIWDIFGFSVIVPGQFKSSFVNSTFPSAIFLMSGLLLHSMVIAIVAILYDDNLLGRLIFLQSAKLKNASELTLQVMRNNLPGQVAEQLLKGSLRIPFEQSHPLGTVMFADVVNYTKFCSKVSSAQVVRTLGSIFETFDSLIDYFDVHKIKTIGDAIMVVGGLYNDPELGAEHCVELALAMLDQHDLIKKLTAEKIILRIGLHTGPVHCGVMKGRKLGFDVWGPTVRAAELMESSGARGKVHISAETHSMIADKFICIRRGIVRIKVLGWKNTFFVTSKRGFSSNNHSGTD